MLSEKTVTLFIKAGTTGKILVFIMQDLSD